MQDQEFWKQAHVGNEPYALTPDDIFGKRYSVEKDLLEAIGDVQGMHVLDLGCGGGRLSVGVAQLGARVTAVDASPTAVAATSALARYNNVSEAVDVHTLDAMQLEELGGPFDLVYGKFILHHIEPFRDFVSVLFNVLSADGRAVFFENNARNALLMFARYVLAGNWGIAKYGDAGEHPLTPEEVKTLGDKFPHVHVYYPNFLFLQLLAPYVLRDSGKFGNFAHRLGLVDGWIYRNVPVLHKYGYHQIVEVQKCAVPT